MINTWKYWITYGITFLALTAAPEFLLAQGTSPELVLDTEAFSRSLTALTMLLVVALLIENALAIIFGWRVFLAYFSLRGVRTIIAIAVSWLVVVTFKFDILGALIHEYTGEKVEGNACLLYTSPSPRDGLLSRMPSSA